MSEGTKRRLAAIVSADVVGYSRLMGRDEAGTLNRLNAHRSELIDGLIENRGGRIVKTTGDGLLLEFPSVVAAVECTIAVQEGMVERNTHVANDDAIHFRIGVHLGDVIVEGDDIFGDGVNIAARLQEIGEADGVVISSNAHDSVEGRIEAGFVDGGEQSLKNIARPVRVWRWSPSASAAVEPANSGAPLALPDKPSIAVLPFDNMSGDPEQEYFADGITEDIITALSKFRWFFVTARNSTFAYKGTSPTVRQVSEELGVRYVMEGSVRKSGNRVRVTGQLIDAATGHHIWADRFDRDLEDIFELQDDITAAIVGAVEPELASAERERAKQKPVENVGAWDLYQRGMWHLGQVSREGVAEAKRNFEQAIEHDPGFGRAYSALGTVLVTEVISGWTKARNETLAAAGQAIQKALEIDEKDAYAHFIAGRLHIARGELEDAIVETERALDLNPNLAVAAYTLGHALVFARRGAEAIPHLDQAMRLSPNDGHYLQFEQMKGVALWSMGELDQSVAWYTKACRHPNAGFWPHVNLAGALAALNRITEARAEVGVALEMRPEISVSAIKQMILGMHPEMLSKYLEDLSRAGLPE